MRQRGNRPGMVIPALAVFLLFGAVQALGQAAPARRLGMEEVLERARRGHPLINSARWRVAAAEAEMLEAGLKPNPSLTLSGENFPLGSAQQGFEFGRSLDWFATYSQTFETAGKRQLRVGYAERNLESARAEASMVERGVLYEVKTAFLGAAIARLHVELRRENLKNLAQLVDLNEVRVREGYTSEGDLIKVRLETQRVEFQLHRAELELDKARIGLLRAIGDADFERFDAAGLAFDVAEDFNFEPVSFNPALLQEAAMKLPQVTLSLARVERARALLRLEQARARPDFTASLGYKRNGVDNAMFAALNIPLPVYNRNQAQIARAEAVLESAQAEYNQVRNVVLAELAAARRSVELTRKQVEALRADFLMRADESRSISLAAYQEGAVDLLVLLDSQRVRAQAQEFYFQALYDYQVAIHELERASGIEKLPRENKSIQTAGNGN